MCYAHCLPLHVNSEILPNIISTTPGTCRRARGDYNTDVLMTSKTHMALSADASPRKCSTTNHFHLIYCIIVKEVKVQLLIAKYLKGIFYMWCALCFRPWVVTLKQICYSKSDQKDEINVISYMYTYTTNTRFVNASSMTLLAPNHNQCRFSLQKRCSLMHYMAVTDIGKPKQAIPFRWWESFLVHFG
jgi:hypothetical protein